jgi:hypothetical protein
LKRVPQKIDGMADVINRGNPTAKAERRGTVRICDVPQGIPLGEALRKADWIAFCHSDATPSPSPATVAWDFIKGPSIPED